MMALKGFLVLQTHKIPSKLLQTIRLVIKSNIKLSDLKKLIREILFSTVQLFVVH